MSAHSTYDALRHLADSWGLVVMTLVFLGLCLWPFRPGAKDHNRTAATMIFEKDNDDVQ
jgi:cytochrome c oxidase cbb3-type subunit 4